MSNSKQYDEFVDKFKTRHTSDDCFTPPNVYAAVLDWAAKKYGFDKSRVVRPFCPSGDYEHFGYAPDAVVVDNPPFSIVTKIVRFYNDRNIRFFLFCPGLTAFSCVKDMRSTVVMTDSRITYDNGVKVNTAFVTNMSGDTLCEVCPDLRNAIKAVTARPGNKKRGLENTAKKHAWPPDIIVASDIQRLAAHGIPFQVRREEAHFIRRKKLDCGAQLFGGGFIISERAAADHAAARARIAAAEVVELSPREKQIQKSMG